jgi:hypothetical protein
MISSLKLLRQILASEELEDLEWEDTEDTKVSNNGAMVKLSLRNGN